MEARVKVRVYELPDSRWLPAFSVFLADAHANEYIPRAVYRSCSPISPALGKLRIFRVNARWTYIYERTRSLSERIKRVYFREALIVLCLSQCFFSFISFLRDCEFWTNMHGFHFSELDFDILSRENDECRLVLLIYTAWNSSRKLLLCTPLYKRAIARAVSGKSVCA